MDELQKKEKRKQITVLFGLKDQELLAWSNSIKDFGLFSHYVVQAIRHQDEGKLYKLTEFEWNPEVLNEPKVKTVSFQNHEDIYERMLKIKPSLRGYFIKETIKKCLHQNLGMEIKLPTGTIINDTLNEKAKHTINNEINVDIFKGNKTTEIELIEEKPNTKENDAMIMLMNMARANKK